MMMILDNQMMMMMMMMSNQKQIGSKLPVCMAAHNWTAAASWPQYVVLLQSQSKIFERSVFGNLQGMVSDVIVGSPVQEWPVTCAASATVYTKAKRRKIVT